MLAMMRLSKPEYSFKRTIEECIAGITGNASLRDKLIARVDFEEEEPNYLALANIGQLYTISNINGCEDPVIVDRLRKSDLMKIYEQYFVPEEKPARKIYNALLNAAKEDCPFCGGIGTPSNLDHFLPKSHFPQFSILPFNLVPACRDCNMGGKGSMFAKNAEDQIIQPYADKSQFFSEQWIFATYHDGNDTQPGEFEYHTQPPCHWSEVDKARVRKHFKDFNLAKRYGIQAGRQLRTVLRQIKCVKESGGNFKSSLLQPGIDAAPFANHWQKGMYQALLNSNRW